jgi:hypothetical protein
LGSKIETGRAYSKLVFDSFLFILAEERDVKWRETLDYVGTILAVDERFTGTLGIPEDTNFLIAD